MGFLRGKAMSWARFSQPAFVDRPVFWFISQGDLHMCQHWLIKSEPYAYSWHDLVAKKEALWDGVRNHSAKRNLAAMEVGDEVFFTIRARGWR